MTMRQRKVFSRVLASFSTFVFFLIAGVLASFGQATGSIVGSVTDPSDARMPGVTVRLINRQTAVERTAVTNAAGAYVFSSLQPDSYEITAEVAGFRRTVQRATVSVGHDVTVDFTLEVGEVTQTIDVVAEASTINLVNSKVDSNISSSEIERLPLIGRSAYEMAKLVPGVLANPTRNRNKEMGISIAGKGESATRITLDGINVTDFFGGGGTAMNFSQDVVQEFQVNVNNADPSVGISSSGTINLVTRRGGNQVHGTFYSFFRNNEYAGFPGLSRPIPKSNPNNDPSIAALNKAQKDPDFFRRQYGGVVSGPLWRDRLFWLVSMEKTSEEAATVSDPNFAEFSSFGKISNYPKERLLQSYRLDWRATDNHSFFARFTRDGLNSRTFDSIPSDPSQDTIRRAGVHVAAIGWTAVLSPTFVGDFRVGFDRWSYGQDPVPEAAELAKLYAPQLPQIGQVLVLGTNMRFGGAATAPNDIRFLRPQVRSDFTYIRGDNTWKFGFAYEPTKLTFFRANNAPMSAVLFNPTQARQAGIPIPATFNTIADLMQLPVSTMQFGVGSDYTYPYTFQGDRVLWTQIFQLYGGSSYKPARNLTLNWSLSVVYNGLAPNRDLPRPASIAPFLDGGRLDPPRNEKANFAPSVGFAWDPVGRGRTVIRGGFGVYYGTLGAGANQGERALLFPVGRGYVIPDGSFVTNPLTGRGTLVFPTAAANGAAGIFRLSDLANRIAGIRSQLEQTVFTGQNEDLSVTNFDFFKGNTSRIHVPNFRLPYTVQSMIGVQRQVGGDWLVDATTIYNVTNRQVFQWDANRRLRAASAGGKVVPALNQVLIGEFGGKAVYRGLLLAARKRLSHRFLMNASYTLSSSKATEGSLVNYDDRKDNFGHSADNPTHLLTVAATVVDLPWGFDVAVVNQMQGRDAFNPFLSGLDLNGDGTRDDRLPGIPQNGINRGISGADLRKAVAEFNLRYEGQRDTLGTLIRPITLPDKFTTGDSIITQDMRVTKKIRIGEQVNVNVIGEVFNIFNIATLGYVPSAGNLYSSGFGQPSDRRGGLFASSGPRSFQFAARVSF